jgi:hypothetical protein
VKVATGRDFADVSPIKGTYRGTGKRQLFVEVFVTRPEEGGLVQPPLAASREK